MATGHAHPPTTDCDPRQACMLGCTRSSLNVVASEKGIVVGRLIFEDDGDTIDCTKMGVGGKARTPCARIACRPRAAYCL